MDTRGKWTNGDPVRTLLEGHDNKSGHTCVISNSEKDETNCANSRDAANHASLQ